MIDFTLEQIFGDGASQDANNLVIQKASLRGLTPGPNNRAEQILAALIYSFALKIRGYLETEQGDRITTESGRALAFDNSSLYLRADCFFLTQTIRRSSQAQFLRTVFVFQFWIKPINPSPQALTPNGVDYAN